MKNQNGVFNGIKKRENEETMIGGSRKREVNRCVI